MHLAFLHILWACVPVFWWSDANSRLIGKVADAGEDWGQRRRACQRMRRLDGITDAMDTNLGNLQEMVRDSEAWGAAVGGAPELDDWTGQRQQQPVLLPSSFMRPFFLCYLSSLCGKNLLYADISSALSAVALLSTLKLQCNVYLTICPPSLRIFTETISYSFFSFSPGYNT